MLDSKSVSTKEHDVILNSRERLSINGVREIINFDENSVNVKTVCGELSIEGENIHINVLNIEKGELEMQGKINGLNYYESNDSERRSLLSRIFK
ncbi:MAG: sporulation protein YabP [Eubacteriales bacterium]